jgi:hypothetical protein
MTGLALLTFLAHGESTTSERYGKTVEKAIRWLVDNQDESGLIAGGGHPAYSHAIATYAVCEAYAFVRSPALRAVMENAVGRIVDGQQEGGGFDYAYKKGERWDLSVTGWQVQALRTAQFVGARVPGLDEATARAVAFLKQAQGDNGRFGYASPGSGSEAMQGVGVLSLQMLGHATAREVRSGLEQLAGADVDWERASGHPLYGWYYITQAKFHQGGRAWRAWNREFVAEFLNRQNDDGSWVPPPGEEQLGPVYGTTLAALTLQVYHKTLLSFEHAPDSPLAANGHTEDEPPLVRVL